MLVEVYSLYPCAKTTHSLLVFRSKENGFHERPPVAMEPAAKRICTISPAPRHSPAHPLPLNTQLHPTPPPLQHYALDDIAAPHILHREHSQRMLEIRELKDRPRLPGTCCRFLLIKLFLWLGS